MKRLLALALLLACAGAQAHPLAPALLELRELAPVADATHDVLWRTSITRAGRSDVAPVLPANCQTDGDVQAGLEDEAWVSRWRVRCAGGLAGQSLAVRGLEASRIAVVLRVQPLQGDALQAVLDARTPAYTVPAPGAAAAVFPSYFVLGVEHLLLGFDHVLFVCGLFLLVSGLRSLLVTITAFTLGHSITLSLASLGYVRVHAGLMELGIALSVLLLAVELARARGTPPGLLARRPWLMASGFGLLHGLGFAGVLAEIGLPAGEIPLALLAFNLGIEAGQIALVLALILLKRLTQQRPLADTMPRLHALPSYAIGTLAAYWCCERLASL